MTTPRQRELTQAERLLLLEEFRAEWEDYATGRKAIPENFGTELKQKFEEGRTLPLAFSLAYDLVVFSGNENKLLPAYEAYCLATLCDPAYPVIESLSTLRTIGQMADRTPAAFAHVVYQSIATNRSVPYAVFYATTFAKDRPEHEKLIVNAFNGHERQAVMAVRDHTPTLVQLLTLAAFHQSPELERQAAQAPLSGIMYDKTAIEPYQAQSACAYGGPLALNQLIDKALPEFLPQLARHGLAVTEAWLGQVRESTLDRKVGEIAPGLDARILVNEALRYPCLTTTDSLHGYVAVGKGVACPNSHVPVLRQTAEQKYTRLKQVQALALAADHPATGFALLVRLHAKLKQDIDLAACSRDVIATSWPRHEQSLSGPEKRAILRQDPVLASRIPAPPATGLATSLRQAWRQLTTRLLRSGRGHEKGPSRNGP